MLFYSIFLIHTYAENAIYNWIVATVAHGKPMTTKENNVDVSISAKMDEHQLIYEAYIDINQASFELIILKLNIVVVRVRYDVFSYN